MANKKATIHSIPLQTMDLCLNKYNSDIKPYSGFRHNNSPYYGGALSPFYTRTTAAIPESSYINDEGIIFKLVDGNLTAEYDGQEQKLMQLADDGYVYRTSYEGGSGNSTYYNILAFIDTGSTPEILASSSAGAVAVVDGTGSLIMEVTDATDTDYTYEPGMRVHFAKRSSAGDYCIAFGDQYYVMCADGTVTKGTWGSATATDMKAACYVDTTNSTFLFMCNNSDYTTIKAYNYSTNTYASSFSSVVMKLSSAGTTSTISKPTNGWCIWTNDEGKSVLYDQAFKVYNSTSAVYYVYQYGTAVECDGTTLTITVDDTKYMLLSSLSYSFGIQDKCLDQYSCLVCGSYNSGYTVYHPAVYHTECQQVYGDLHILWWTIANVWLGTRWVVVEDSAAYTETVDSKFNAYMLNGSTGLRYDYVPLDMSTYTYNGGVMATIGSHFRALYHGGSGSLTLQGVSVANSDAIVGTLLTGMGNISEDYVISHGTDGDDEWIAFNDGNEWVMVTYTTDTSNATLTVADRRFLIVNTAGYYNCYDLQDLRPHHYASDWNDRGVLSCAYSASPDVGTEASTFYTTYCTNYAIASGQAINYESLGTPYCSTQFAAYNGGIPKTVTAITVYTPGGYSPDDADIDFYYGTVSSDGSTPEYKFSADYRGGSVRKYINTKLDGASMVEVDGDILMTPSLFAEYIDGFINSAIVIEGSSSYLQTFANSVNPVFLISMASELEDINAAFIIQGMYYVIIGNAIYRYDQSSGSVSAILDIGDMTLVGYTPYQAILWSDANRTFYTFTGDNTLSMLTQANEISSIVHSVYNPNTMGIYIIADSGVYIFGNQQLIKLDYDSYRKAFPLDDGMALIGDSETRYLSYNEEDGYTALPIVLETEFYGEGSNAKAINDCVYIRLFSATPMEGKVKLRVQTLNEGSRKTETKTFNITKEMWDEDTGTVFLRYQPQYQSATGFSVRIESPFAIGTLDISEAGETIQNSRYNI